SQRLLLRMKDRSYFLLNVIKKENFNSLKSSRNDASKSAVSISSDS
ncbi:1046_t:CDS:1, partial [Rhizophagus irregularis]